MGQAAKVLDEVWIWVGNSAELTEREEREYLKYKIKYKFGEQAYDIHGKELSPQLLLPLYIHKDSYVQYDNMMRRACGFTVR